MKLSVFGVRQPPVRKMQSCLPERLMPSNGVIAGTMNHQLPQQLLRPSPSFLLVAEGGALVQEGAYFVSVHWRDQEAAKLKGWAITGSHTRSNRGLAVFDGLRVCLWLSACMHLAYVYAQLYAGDLFFCSK